jgi:hypothetical protein
MKTSRAFLAALACAATVGLFSCGVRGNPQPPLTAPELGHGEPGFKRASQEFAFPNVPSPTPVPMRGSRPNSRGSEDVR